MRLHSASTNLLKPDSESFLSIQRIASGMRITRAADDPGSAAVATDIDTQNQSRRAAIQNIEDAMNLALTAEGGIDQIVTMVQRLTALAVGASSDTLTDKDRENYQTEFDEILAEIDVTARAENYNNTGLLAFRPVDVGFVIDSSASMTSLISAVTSSIDNFKQRFEAAKLDVGLGLAEINDSRDPIDSYIRLADIASDDFDDALSSLTVEGAFVDTYGALAEATGISSVTGLETEGEAFGFREFSLQNSLILITDTSREITVAGTGTEAEIASALAAQGIEVHTLKASGGGSRSTYTPLEDETGGLLLDVDASTMDTQLDLVADHIAEQLAEAGELSFQIGNSNKDADRIDSPFPFNMTVVSLQIDTLTLDSAANAQSAITSLGEALDKLNSGRAEVGSFYRRLSHRGNLAEVTQQVGERSRSQMEEIDYATQSITLSKDIFRDKMYIDTMRKAHQIDRDMVIGVFA